MNMENLKIPTSHQGLPNVGNFLYALMKALEKDQETMSEQQLVDADSTKIAAQQQADLYDYWQQQLDADANGVADAAKSKDNPSEKTEAAQAKFNADNAEAQAAESKQDGLIQSWQGQTTTDASNLQTKVQMQQSANTILSTLSNMLGQIIGA